MRKVSFLRRVLNQQSGSWVIDGEQKGWFHCWGAAYEEFESGAGNYTVAIVEMPDGSIETPPAHEVTFLEPPQ